MKLWKPKDIDVTGGPLLSSIVRYSIPVMLATFLQTLFNAVDIMVLGNMADKVAVASVGATSVIVSLCVMAFVGLSAGTSILLSRYFGAGEEDGRHLPLVRLRTRDSPVRRRDSACHALSPSYFLPRGVCRRRAPLSGDLFLRHPDDYAL